MVHRAQNKGTQLSAPLNIIILLSATHRSGSTDVYGRRPRAGILRVVIVTPHFNFFLDETEPGRVVLRANSECVPRVRLSAN